MLSIASTRRCSLSRRASSGLPQRGDVVEPRDALAAGEADMAAPVRHLHVRHQGMDRPTLFRLPDHLLVQELTAAFPQGLDDRGSMIEIMPELFRVEEVQFLLVVAEHLAQARIVEDEAPLLVEKAEARRAVLEELAELALLIGDLRL